MHSGQQYHQFILSSPRDCAVRQRFQGMALELLADGEDVLDFGAGTGIDAKVFAAHGHRTFVYEPAGSMSEYLAEYCRDEIADETVVAIPSPLACKVHAATADFAVLNYFDDHTLLFNQLSHVIDHEGFFLASMLSPYYLPDMRYGWWWKNMLSFIQHGHYGVSSESHVHRFAPSMVAHAATPYFRLERMTPHGIGLAGQLYMFLLFRRN